MAFSQQLVMPTAPFVSSQSPKYEVRAVWLTTIGGLDWPHSYAQSAASITKQKNELISLFDKYKEAGINTVLIQTRVRATTIYPSKYEPWDGCLSGKPGEGPGYDALAFAIEECHKRGMELHAWVVTIPVGKWNGKGCSSLRKKYPKLIKKIGEDGYMDPESAETGRYLANICEEITTNYDVDGIHLDYIRYPETWKIKVSRKQGRAYITDIVRLISSRVKSIKPWVKMSCSPVGKYDDLPRQTSRGWNANTIVCQDAQGWLRDGLMDALFPMMYFKDNNFYPFAIDWKERSYGKIVAPGLGIYFMSPKEQNWSLKTITQEMEVLRTWGLGHCFFRGKFFTDNTKGFYSFVKKEFNAVPALVPPMNWATDKKPTAPTELRTDSISGVLSWSGAKDNSGSPNLIYNIYSSWDWPVDITNPENLMVTATRQSSLKVPLNGRYYAVTAMNRFGLESPAKQNIEYSKAPSRAVGIHKADDDILPVFSCDGNFLQLGKLPVNNSDLIIIETIQGIQRMVVFYSEKVDVQTLSPGTYIVKTLGKKKSSHRIGYFQVKR